MPLCAARCRDSPNEKSPGGDRAISTSCDALQAGALTPTGFEHKSKSPEKQGVAQRDGAESGAVNDAAGSDLAQLVSVWTKLPSCVRAEILALIREAESVRAQIQD